MDISSEPPDVALSPLVPIDSVSSTEPSKAPHARVRLTHIFLLVLIIIGASLLISQKYWIPSLVNFLLYHQTESNIQTGTDVSTTTESNGFITYKNTALGFSIVFPKTAYKNEIGCTFNNDRQSYEFQTATSTEAGQVPLQALAKGNIVYVDFAYFYDLIQKESGSPIYSHCLKQTMPEYLARYLNKTPYPNDFSDDEPISITVENASSTQAAEAIAIASTKSASGNYCSEVVMTPATQRGVFDFSPKIPPIDTSQSDGIGPSCDYVPRIKYSPTAAKIVIIKDGPHQYCPFSHDGFANSFFDPTCYNRQIDTSFLFLQQ
ncbi:MAG: hypothetical protein JWN49_247 [Parcubacteria group bacterium]|nr:hypothetical protein [Parcubacteria group bacterium]